MLEELVHAVRTRAISAAELVNRALERIERLDSPINAVVALRAEQALEEARDFDRQVTRGQLGGPLAGLPVLVKDVEDVAGMATTYGSLLFADAPPAPESAITPARLRAAGAIIIGKSNTSEFAFQGFTENRLFGTTHNPWDLGWSPGGSSGGSAAALAGGLIAVATATDGGGSARGPAAFCGLVGFKPTNGLIGRRPAPLWLDLTTDGIIGVSIADVRLLLWVMAGPVVGDPAASPRLPMKPAGDLPGRLIAAPRIQAGPPLPADLDRLYKEAIRRLEVDLRLPIEPIDPGAIFPGPYHPDDDSLVLIEAETVAWLGRETIERERDRFDPHFAVYLDQALAITLDEYLAARRRRFDHARRLDALLGEDTVLVTPTRNIAGMLGDGRVPDAGTAELTNAMANTNPQNVTGHPAISVPAGRQENGLPFGLQFTGPRFRDDLLLRLAETWEAAAPWPLSAPGYARFDADR